MQLEITSDIYYLYSSEGYSKQKHNEMKRAILTSSLVVALLLSNIATSHAKKEKSDYRSAYAKEGMTGKEIRQAKKNYEKEHGIKTGWNFGPFPAISYNSDLGFQYGALCDIFYYGDGHQFPGYQHKFNVEVSRYTKGETLAHLFYDSKYLIPGGIRLTAAATYLNSQMNSFYGFNGYATPYNYNFVNKKHQDYNPAYYADSYEMVRALCDIQVPISKNFTLMTGLTFWDIKTGGVGLKKYQDSQSLYKLYRKTGLIRDNEVSGSHLDFKIGALYDTRDHELAPQRGFCFEMVGVASTDLRNNGNNFYRIMASWRHFIPVGGRVVLAYRVASQETFGNAPFYMLQTIQTLYLRQIKSEGLGGMNTIRGVLQNRIIGQGYAWANFECRVRIVDFRFIKQMWRIAVNPFVDMGVVTRGYRLEEQKRAAELYPELYSGAKNGFHGSAGIGAKLIMNQNFILSVEWGMPFDRRDGSNGLNVGLNYIF